MPMLYMVVERFKSDAAPEIYRRVRAHGRQLPPGLEYLDSWVDMNYTRCFQLMRTEEPMLFEAWKAAWADLVDFEVIPVRTSNDAAQVIAPKL
jgi:hypothetical protein